MSKQNRRIKSIDFFKGFLMFYIIILHPIIQRVFSQDVTQFEKQMTTIPIWLAIIGTPFIIISLWGTAFTLMTGCTVAFKMAQKAKNAQDQNVIMKEFQSRMINGCLIFLMHLINVGFFFNMSQEHPIATHSLITGSIESGKFILPNFFHLITSSTLESIAITGIAVSCILYLIWRKEYNYKKAIIILSALSMFVFGVSLIFSFISPDPMAHAETLFNSGKYVSYFIFTRMHTVRFAIFPVFGFGLVGAIIGIIFAEKRTSKSFTRPVLMISFVSFTLFLISTIREFNLLEDFAKENVPITLQFLNLSLQIFCIVLLARLFDYRKSNKKPVNKRSLIGRLETILKRYTNSSLTIFMIEPFFSIIIYKIFLNLYGGPIDENPGLIALYIFIIIISWFFGLKLWSNYRFKYSAEYFLGKMKSRLLIYRRNNPFIQVDLKDISMYVPIKEENKNLGTFLKNP